MFLHLHPPAMPILPQELLDMIIDHLHSDRTTLLTCSLIPHLHHPSRYHLFTSLPIHLHFKSIITLSHLLHSPLNTISPHTRFIILENMTHLVCQHSLPDILRALRVLPRSLSRLGNASAVRFSNTDFTHLPAEIPALLIRCFRALHTIELHNLHFLRFCEVADMLSSMKGMRRAVVKRVSWTYGFGLMRRCPMDVEWRVGGMEEEDAKVFMSWLGLEPEVVVRKIRSGSQMWTRLVGRPQAETSWYSVLFV